MTNYNTADVIERCFDSILNALDAIDYEIIVVDNMSGDGSFEWLAMLSRQNPRVRLIRKRCLRGMGWQTAFRASSAPTIAIAACDTVYNDAWRRLIARFLEERFSFGIIAVLGEVYPRGELDSVGGWRNLQYWEDVDLRARLASIGSLRIYPVVCGQNLKRTPASNRTEQIYRLYRKIHDKILVATWIPARFYLVGYARAILRQGGTRAFVRLPYYLSILTLAILVARAQRRGFQARGVDARILNAKNYAIDLGLVPRQELAAATSQYDSFEGCRDALARGDFGFLPGFYD